MKYKDILLSVIRSGSGGGGGYPEPTGTKTISENGVHNVKDYASADVQVPSQDLLRNRIAQGTGTELLYDYIYDDDTHPLKANAFNGDTNLRSITAPYITELPANAFNGCSNLTSVDFPLLTTVGSNAFRSCVGLTDMDTDNIVSIGNYGFAGTGQTRFRAPHVTELTGTGTFQGTPIGGDIYFPELTTVAANCFGQAASITGLVFDSLGVTGNTMCTRCTNLGYVDLGAAITRITNGAFSDTYGCVPMVIIRRTDGLVTLDNVSAFSTTGSTIYVPDALVSQYQAATNWSHFSSKIRGLSALSESMEQRIAAARRQYD